ncbi:MAG: hypothetical protein JW703_02660, partial [Candidatus Diapherotrites archaeon]|nr:hypothetical protein [Candidatus Diapherotrites archaeon]
SDLIQGYILYLDELNAQNQTDFSSAPAFKKLFKIQKIINQHNRAPTQEELINLKYFEAIEYGSKKIFPIAKRKFTDLEKEINEFMSTNEFQMLSEEKKQIISQYYSTQIPVRIKYSLDTTENASSILNEAFFKKLRYSGFEFLDKYVMDTATDLRFYLIGGIIGKGIAYMMPMSIAGNSVKVKVLTFLFNMADDVISFGGRTLMPQLVKFFKSRNLIFASSGISLDFSKKSFILGVKEEIEKTGMLSPKYLFDLKTIVMNSKPNSLIYWFEFLPKRKTVYEIHSDLFITSELQKEITEKGKHLTAKINSLEINENNLFNSEENKLIAVDLVQAEEVENGVHSLIIAIEEKNCKTKTISDLEEIEKHLCEINDLGICNTEKNSDYLITASNRILPKTVSAWELMNPQEYDLLLIECTV